jgi:hypothetical protein
VGEFEEVFPLVAKGVHLTVKVLGGDPRARFVRVWETEGSDSRSVRLGMKGS